MKSAENDTHSIHKNNGIVFIFGAVLSIIVIGVTIFGLLSYYKMLNSQNVFFLYMKLFIANLVIYIFQIIIGLQLIGKIRLKKKHVSIIGHICIMGSVIQTVVITLYAVIVFSYRFSELRTISMIAFLPLICGLFIPITALSGFKTVENKCNNINIFLIYFFIIYATIISVLTFMPFDPDIENKFAYPLKLRRKVVLLDDISYSGGEIHYVSYYTYLIVGMISALSLGFVNNRLRKKK